MGQTLAHLAPISSLHRHLRITDCLMARTACLVCFISTVNGHSKKEEKKAIMGCASSGHTTKLKQSIFALRYLWFLINSDTWAQSYKLFWSVFTNSFLETRLFDKYINISSIALKRCRYQE